MIAWDLGRILDLSAGPSIQDLTRLMLSLGRLNWIADAAGLRNSGGGHGNVSLKYSLHTAVMTENEILRTRGPRLQPFVWANTCGCRVGRPTVTFPDAARVERPT